MTHDQQPDSGQTSEGEMQRAAKAIYGNREGAYTADMAKIERVAAALAQAKAEGAREARIDELQRIDGLAYGDDYYSYQHHRLAELQNINEETQS